MIRRPCPAHSTRRSGSERASPGAGCTTDRDDCGKLVGEPVLRRPVTLPALARMSLRPDDLRAVAPWRTLDALAGQMFADPRMRMWLNRYATYSGSDPRRIPAVLSVTSFVEQEFGAWYVPGGLRRIVEAVAARCRELGVEIHTNSAVEAVLVSGGRASGVRVGGRTIAPPTLLSATSTPPSSMTGCCPRAPRGRQAPGTPQRPIDGRLRPVARAGGPHGGSGAPGLFPARLRRRVRRDLRPPTATRRRPRRSTCTPPTTRRCVPATTPRAGS